MPLRSKNPVQAVEYLGVHVGHAAGELLPGAPSFGNNHQRHYSAYESIEWIRFSTFAASLVPTLVSALVGSRANLLIVERIACDSYFFGRDSGGIMPATR
jgi:hypothetical protein